MDQHLVDHKTKTMVGKYINEKLDTKTDSLEKSFSVLEKCKNKLDCFLHQKLMFCIKRLEPSLKSQPDSICAKLFP